MGSILKIVAGAYDRRAEATELKEKRKALRYAQEHKQNLEFQEQTFGKADNHEIVAYVRQTRRIIAIIGMLNFAIISILCTLYPSQIFVTFSLPEYQQGFSILWGFIKFPTDQSSTVVITTGHIALGSMVNLGAILGFYFTPGGKA
jgi:hypothetical protein